MHYATQLVSFNPYFEYKKHEFHYLLRKAAIDIVKNKKNYLSVIAYYNGHIPIVDIDIEDDIYITLLWLQENKITYSLIKSSPRKYWVILDRRYSAFKQSYQMMNIVPNNDSRYLYFSKKYQFTHIRALPKNNFLPELINLGEDKLVNDFVNQFINNFRSKEIQFLIRYLKFIDPSFKEELQLNPRCGEPLNFTVEDLLKEDYDIQTKDKIDVRG